MNGYLACKRTKPRGAHTSNIKNNIYNHTALNEYDFTLQQMINYEGEARRVLLLMID